jgi:hypothetical protein
MLSLRDENILGAVKDYAIRRRIETFLFYGRTNQGPGLE